jgi:hypothetical protein
LRKQAALLPDSGLGVSNYLFSLKMHPCPDTTLFFIIRTQVRSLFFIPMARLLSRSSRWQNQKTKWHKRSGSPPERNQKGQKAVRPSAMLRAYRPFPGCTKGIKAGAQFPPNNSLISVW